MRLESIWYLVATRSRNADKRRRGYGRTTPRAQSPGDFGALAVNSLSWKPVHQSYGRMFEATRIVPFSALYDHP